MANLNNLKKLFVVFSIFYLPSALLTGIIVSVMESLAPSVASIQGFLTGPLIIVLMGILAAIHLILILVVIVLIVLFIIYNVREREVQFISHINIAGRVFSIVTLVLLLSHLWNPGIYGLTISTKDNMLCDAILSKNDPEIIDIIRKSFPLIFFTYKINPTQCKTALAFINQDFSKCYEGECIGGWWKDMDNIERCHNITNRYDRLNCINSKDEGLSIQNITFCDKSDTDIDKRRCKKKLIEESSLRLDSTQFCLTFLEAEIKDFCLLSIAKNEKLTMQEMPFCDNMTSMKDRCKLELLKNSNQTYDITICDDIKSPDFRSDCQAIIVNRTKISSFSEIGKCQLIEEEYKRPKCALEIIQKLPIVPLENLSFCDTLPVRAMDICKSLIITKASLKLENISICNTLQGSNRERTCKFNIINNEFLEVNRNTQKLAWENLVLCEIIESEFSEQSCKLNLIEKSKDKFSHNICNNFNYTQKTFCERKFRE